MFRRLLLTSFIGSLFLLYGAPEAIACWSSRTQERHLVHLTDQTRVAHERPALRYSAALSKAARVHSRRMAERNRLYHNTYATISTLLGGSWTKLGENVGNGSRIRTIQRAFMRSPEHRENILGSWRKLGVGIVHQRDRFWVTVLFGTGGTVRSKVGAETC
jgi:uncharacterized protein YkwD